MNKLDQIIQILTNVVVERGATANDDNGIVRALVTQHGLGFNAWFCICCELANREARSEGFADKVDRAYALAKRLVVKGDQA